MCESVNNMCIKGKEICKRVSDYGNMKEKEMCESASDMNMKVMEMPESVMDTDWKYK